jgi:hypothetical protein
MTALHPTIKIPQLNPIRLYEDVEDKAFALSISKHQQQVKYTQIFSRFDTISFQIGVEYNAANTNEYKVQVYDINDTIVYTTGYIAPLWANFNGYDIFWWNMGISADLGLPQGAYQLEVIVRSKVTSGGAILQTVYFYSEPLYFQDLFDDSILIKYGHSNNNFDLICIDPDDGVTPIYFYHRFYGGFDTRDYEPSSKDYVYRDQQWNLTQLDSIPFNVQKLTIGDGGGIPNWQANIINRIFSCDYLLINNNEYIKNEGAKMEKTVAEMSPMAGWKIELAESLNTNSISHIYELYDFNVDFNVDFLINI